MSMQRYIINIIKLCLLFLCCTLLFYFALRAIHYEYDYYHRYDEPEGTAVKVFVEENNVIDYLYDFLRIGE